MITELGAFALVLALTLSVAQTGLSAVGGARRSVVLAGAGRGAAVAVFLAVAVAFACLIHAFVVSDFSVANVAANSHTAKPMLYKVAGAWGSHEGSMLLWCLVLTGYGAAMAFFGDSLPPRLRSYAIAIQGALGVLFLAYTVFASNPMERLLDAPIEGRSLNPLLQDPALAFHPPFLYAGYVGFSVVYSLSLAALIEGRIDAAWARWVRPWTLAAWSLLTVGITLGAFWAYYELGWGGWWFWDPVENASFMPWLIGAALLHSAIVTEKRGALPGWTAFLALAAFTFSMLGAFLVRSGVLTSVHAFAVDPTRGVLLLIMMGVAAGAGFLLFALRAPTLNPGGQFRTISRESAIVLNNILLSTATAVVLLGTLFPLIREALDGEAVSVGAPFFNLTFVPLMILAFAVLPAGPLLAWKRGDAGGVARKLWVVLAAAVVLGLIAYAVVQPRKALASGGLVVGFWLIGGALLELSERLKLFRAPAAESARRARGLPRGAWGTTLAHAGLGLFVLGASFETAWRVEAAQALSLNDSQPLGAYTLTLKKVGTVEGPNYLAERGVVDVVDKAGRVVCRATPERRFYPTGGQTTSEVSICPGLLDDIYVVMGERRAGEGGKPAWLIRAYVNPWVRLIFLAPLLMAIGGAVSLSDRRVRLGVGRRTQETVS
ncbi:heme lyase CcmF/NrfE family subunit [Caulobacter segnis]|uniref:Cytochrome c-type biogenesis protein CcmF n=2 Tax=Caulobacter segnis TaxID=88688 RepID=D5VIE1_CAUST|nr:heme lyase CcmF/NrfE family subunit [Caulobacter segnis]ADG09515.1 cytochrome c-type biogenesis protein CcmF [Caulobacter segnis ATCC 21756]AVQ01304.1 heme lyase CcmF/NrfE family subunit [Caulobacter segnis]